MSKRKVLHEFPQKTFNTTDSLAVCGSVFVDIYPLLVWSKTVV